jgi:hypothetical protein
MNNFDDRKHTLKFTVMKAQIMSVAQELPFEHLIDVMDDIRDLIQEHNVENDTVYKHIIQYNKELNPEGKWYLLEIDPITRRKKRFIEPTHYNTETKLRGMLEYDLPTDPTIYYMQNITQDDGQFRRSVFRIIGNKRKDETQWLITPKTTNQ